MRIKDIVDKDRKSPGEKFKENWLTNLSTSQWSPYIDSSAELVMRDIGIGDTNLMKVDFARETGPYYRSGLTAAMGINQEETSLPIGSIRAHDVGTIAWALKNLQHEIRTSTGANYRSTSRALEAIINKSLLGSIDSEDYNKEGVETVRLPENASVSDLVSELLCRPRSERFVDTLIEIANESKSSGKSLLRLLEEPRMVTPLWDHQREALKNWLDKDGRGYVDMATATGKTFLGLAAISHHFGCLHPQDAPLANSEVIPTESDATVVVVAHRSVILNQWKREFDTHLNIPEEGAAEKGEHTASYSWGRVHFWTPRRLLENEVPDADLVILDEAHHYLGSSGFGSILDEIDCDLLALSGSIDEENARTLERRDIPKLFEFSLKDGQEVGIIPRCDWHIEFVPYEGQSRLAEVTKQCLAGFKQYCDGDVASEISNDYNPSDLSFETLGEARSVVHTSAGRAATEKDDEFREFASAIKSRSLTKYNLSPTLSKIGSLTLEHVHDHKCVVLLESGDEIETVVSHLKRELTESEFEELVTVVWESGEETLEAVETFDEDQDTGALVGTATVLGEGVDIKTADVGINRSRGQVNRSLIQRIGRILRNPKGDKRAKFYHVMGLPTNSDAMVAREDGIDLLETGSQLVVWGDSFDAKPWFSTTDDSVKEALPVLEAEGVSGIREFSPDHYDWPKNETVKDQLESFCNQVEANESKSVLLALEGDKIEPEYDNRRETVRKPVSGSDGEAVMVCTEALSTYSSTNQDDASEAVTGILRNQLSPDVDVSSEEDSTTADLTAVRLNPTLRGVVRTIANEQGVDESRIIEWAIRRENEAGKRSTA